MVEVGHLTRHVSTFETTDILTAALYALLTAGGTAQHLTQSGGHTLDIVGSDIERVGTARLLKTGARTGHDGQTAADGLDNRYAETLVDRRIDERLGLVVEHVQTLIADAMEQMETMAQTGAHGFFLHLFGIGRRLADSHQVDMLGQ